MDPADAAAPVAGQPRVGQDRAVPEWADLQVAPEAQDPAAADPPAVRVAVAALPEAHEGVGPAGVRFQAGQFDRVFRTAGHKTVETTLRTTKTC